MKIPRNFQIQIGNNDLWTIFDSDVMSLDDYVHVVLRRNNYACNTLSEHVFVKIREVMSSAGKLQYDWACNMSFHVFHQFWWLWNIQIHVLTPFVVCRSHFNSSHIQWFILHSTNNEPFVITRSWYAWNSSIENLTEIHIKFQYTSYF